MGIRTFSTLKKKRFVCILPLPASPCLGALSPIPNSRLRSRHHRRPHHRRNRLPVVFRRPRHPRRKGRRHHFVMEYVPGVRITDYCDQKRLKTRERLELFVKVCEGVLHAHQILQESSGFSWACVLPEEQPRDFIKNLSPKFWW